MIELQHFLRTARRRLWLARFALTIDRGLVIGNGVALLGLLWNLLVGKLPLVILAAAVAVPCVAALLWAGRQRPTLETAARWADERCRAAGTFATGLEFLLQARGTGSPAALAALRARLGRMLPAAAAQVAAERLPGKRRLALLTGMCVVLCGLGLHGPAARAGLRPAVAAPDVRAAADLAPAPAEDFGRAAERLRTALKDSVTATAPGSRHAEEQDEGLRARVAARARPAGAEANAASANRDSSARGDSPGDGGGREAGSSTAPPSERTAAGAAARFRAAFRDLETARNPDGGARAGRESLELEGRAGSSEAADFDARQRAEAPYARRAAAPREAPRAVESAAARALLRRYAALTAASR